MNEDRPTVSLDVDSSPETLTLVRGVLGGLAEGLSLDPELLDDIKTAVSEACNNVVMHAYGGDSGPLRVALYVGDEAIEVLVRDRGHGIHVLTPSDDRLQGVGIPIMRALAQKTAFRPLPEGGTEVWMEFAGRRDGELLYRQPGLVVAEDGWGGRLRGRDRLAVPCGLRWRSAGPPGQGARGPGPGPTRPVLRRLPGHRCPGGSRRALRQRRPDRVRHSHRAAES